MSALREMHVRRVLWGVLCGLLVGVAGFLASGPVVAVVLGPFAAGVVVGWRSRSPLNETPMESFLAGMGVDLGLYLGFLVSLAVFNADSPVAGDVLFVAGAFGWLAVAVSLPLLGGLGFVGGLVGRRAGPYA
jgi:hypothetical protein